MLLSRKEIYLRRPSVVWGVAVAAFLGIVASLFLGSISRLIAIQLAQVTAAFLFGFFFRKWWSQKEDPTKQVAILFEEGKQLELWSELSQTGQWYYDLRSRRIFASQKMWEVYGLVGSQCSEKITFEDILRRIHPDDRELVLKGLQTAMEGGSQVIDYRIIVNGKIRHLHTNRIPRYDETGKIIGIDGCSQDITELVEAKLAAKQSEDRMRKLIENAQILICTINPETLVVTFHNKWYEAALGYTREEFAKRTIIEATYPDDREKSKQAYERILSGKSDHERLEKRYITKTGSLFTVDLSLIAIRDQDGKLENILAVAVDINDRKRAEEALRKSEERFRIATQSVHIGLWDYNLQTKRVFWTPESFTLLGYPVDEAEEHPDYEFYERVHPNDIDKMYEALEQHCLGKTPEYRCEFRIRCADGHWTWNMGIGKIVEWAKDGEPLRMLGVQIDINRQKQLEFELIRAREDAERANVAKSAFLANMSHEIRTPMTAILGFTELLESPDLDKEEAKEFLKTIQRNGQHLLQLINDILDLSKIDSGWFTIKPKPCDYLTVAKEALEVMRVRALKKGIKLYLEAKGEVPNQMETDPDRLRQCLINLLGNAIKFTDKGDIRLQLKYLPAWHFNRPAMQFKVIDTGIGIPEDKIESLFNPFVQADDSMARQHGGTGLGLAITKQIAEMLGGKIQGESELDRGSTFTITLPIGKIPDLQMVEIPERVEVTAKPFDFASEVSEKVAYGTPSIKNALNRKQILLAEDGPDNQRFICTTLYKAGAKVDVAENGRIAVEMVRANPDRYDLILMDMQMPEMDGYEATSVLRQIGVETPIIALTAHAFVEESEKCKEIGCTDFCAKPIKPKELIDVILKHLEETTTKVAKRHETF